MRAAVLAMALVLAACGGEREGVTVTEAEPVASLAPSVPPPPRLDAPLDTVDADSLLGDLAPDSLAADTTDADTIAASGPDFRAFWPRFRDALAAGPEAVAPLTAFAPDSLRPSYAPPFEDLLSEIQDGGLFRDPILALTARDFRVDGDARDVWVTVAYDEDGNVTVEDEGVSESGLGLRFEVVDGAYRLVRIDVAG
ncbi:MAG: hypothetical protein AAF845_13885 [Bacteroidota bacterium]